MQFRILKFIKIQQTFILIYSNIISLTTDKHLSKFCGLSVALKVNFLIISDALNINV